MSIITISEDAYSGGDTIAKKAAAELGYECIDHQVYEEAARSYGVAPDKLENALRVGPSFFGMSMETRKRYVTYVRAALAAHFLKDELVYQGPFGHRLVPGVSHVLRVRLTAQEPQRIARAMKTDGLSERAAAKQVHTADDAQKKLAELLFHIDEADESRVDLVVDTSDIDAEEAAARLVDTVREKRYQPMTYSTKLLEEFELAYRAQAVVADVDPEAEAKVEGPTVRVRLRADDATKPKVRAQVEERLRALDGVEEAEVEVLPDSIKRRF